MSSNDARTLRRPRGPVRPALGADEGDRSAGGRRRGLGVGMDKASGAIAGLVLLAYLPVVVSKYGFADDFFALVAGQRSPQVLWDTAAQGGRPLYGGFLAGAFQVVEGVSGLQFLRALGLFGVTLFALLLYRNLRWAGIGAWSGTCIAIALSMVPSFQVYVSWAVCASVPFAAVAALIAGSWRPPRLRAPIDRTAKRTVVMTAYRFAPPLALEIGAYLIYQPAAAFIWLPVAVRVLVGDRKSARPDARLFCENGIIFVAGAIVDFATLKIVSALMGTTNARSSIVVDLGDKVHWFVSEPLMQAGSAFSLERRLWLVILVVVVGLMGLLLRNTFDVVQTCLRAMAMVLVVVLTYFSNLAIADDWASFRTQGALECAVALAFLLGLDAIVRESRASVCGAPQESERNALTARKAIVGGAAGLAIVLASHNVISYFVAPQEIEWHAVSNAILDMPPGPVYAVPAQWSNSAAPHVYYDEFGLPTNAQVWAVVPYLQTVWHARTGAWRDGIEVVTPAQAKRLPEAHVLRLGDVLGRGLPS